MPGSVRGEHISLLFPALRATCIPWLMSSSFQVQSQSPCVSPCLSSTVTSPPLTTAKRKSQLIRPECLDQALPDKLGKVHLKAKTTSIL